MHESPAVKPASPHSTVDHAIWTATAALTAVLVYRICLTLSFLPRTIDLGELFAYARAPLIFGLMTGYIVFRVKHIGYAALAIVEAIVLYYLALGSPSLF